MRRSIRPGPTSWVVVILSMCFHAPLAGAVCPAPLFGNRVDHGVQQNPHDAAIGDFDRDGRPDIAVACAEFQAGPGGVTLLLGRFSGFERHDLTVTGNPFGVGVADFDGDGYLDLAVACLSGTIAVLRGRASTMGEPPFLAPAYFPTGSAPFDVSIGDFNEDGAPDLAIPSNSQQRIDVMLGNGTGGFGPPTPYATPSINTAIAVADFDEDGIQDLAATSHYAGRVVVFRGSGTGGVGDGTFQAGVPYPATNEPFAIASADLDGDGILDLVAGDAGFNGIAVLRGGGSGGVGDGTFSPPQTIHRDGTQNAGLAIGDWNGDGHEDVAAGDGRGDVIAVLLGDGTGSLGGATELSAGRTSFPLTSADLDQDGADDLIGCNYLDGSVTIYRGTCGAAPPASNAPVLTDVRDVPNDEGGYVFVTWLASRLDAPGESAITGYRVWRRIHASEPAMMKERRDLLVMRRDQGDETLVTYWEAMATLPAQQLEGYGYTSPTTQDSTKDSNRYTAFFVTALTVNPSVHYSSNVDSGYSVDNIKPKKGKNFVAAAEGTGTRLTWSPADEADVSHYEIHGGTGADFVPSAETLLEAVEDTTLLDASGSTHYKLVVVDLHDNGSEPVLANSGSTTGVDGGAIAFGIRAIQPNPVTGSELRCSIALPHSAPARLDILDATGRRLSTTLLANGAGRHTVAIGGVRALPAGVYWARLSHGPLSHSLRFVRIP